METQAVSGSGSCQLSCEAATASAMDTASPIEAVSMEADESDEKVQDTAMDSPRPVDIDMPTAVTTEAMESCEISSPGDAAMPSPHEVMETTSPEESVAMEAEDVSVKTSADSAPSISGKDVAEFRPNADLSANEVVEQTPEPAPNKDDINTPNNDGNMSDQQFDNAAPLGFMTNVVGHVVEEGLNPDKALEAVKESALPESIGVEDEAPLFQIACVQSVSDAAESSAALDRAASVTEERTLTEVEETIVNDEPSEKNISAIKQETPNATDAAGSESHSECKNPDSAASVASVKIKAEPVDQEYEKIATISQTEAQPAGVANTVNTGTSIPAATTFDNKTPISVKSEKGDKSDKPKSKKHHKCIVCGNVSKCKYNIVRNGDVKHLCNDTCFQTFRANPSQYLSTQNADSKERATSPKTVTPPVVQEPSPLRAIAPLPKRVQRFCVVCKKTRDTVDLPLVWQTLDFCSDGCLDRLQKSISVQCGTCKQVIPAARKCKFCAASGREVTPFCSADCRNEYLRTVKNCAYCHKNVTGKAYSAPMNNVFHDFCGSDCFQAFKKRNASLQPSVDSTPKEKSGVKPGCRKTRLSSGMATCSVCRKMANYKHEFMFDKKQHKFCSDECFAGFRFTNKLETNLCNQCNLPCHPMDPRFQFEGRELKFCTASCLRYFVISGTRIIPCSWCAAKMANFDMIQKVVDGSCESFCSLNCLSLYRVNSHAATGGNVVCDQCKRCLRAQYHLTMSDATVRNFCSYNCVVHFQDQFKTRPVRQHMLQPKLTTSVMPVVTKVSGIITNPSASTSILPKQQFQHTVVSNGALVASSKPSSGSSVPIISSVMSLAPLNKLTSVSTAEAGSAPPAAKPAPPKPAPGQVKETVITKETEIKYPPAPLMKNKSVITKPLTQTKATTCRPHSVNKDCQTDEGSGIKYVPIPIPVPIYVPVPVVMYHMPTPQPVPLPVPVPIPIFIPTGSGSADQVLDKIKDIKRRIPDDPYEAELLMMAEAVADAECLQTPEKEAAMAKTNGDTSDVKLEPSYVTLLSSDAETMMAAGMKKAEHADSDDCILLDLEMSLDNPNGFETDNPRRGTKRTVTRGRSRGRPPKRQKTTEVQPVAPQPVSVVTSVDADCLLKFTYGVNAWKHWVRQKNAQLENEMKSTPRIRLFKSDLLECSADELNYALSLFVKEVRKPNGEEYAADSVFYLCLGIQSYLFHNGRSDNIFTDVYYEKFTDCLNAVVSSFSPRLSSNGELICRIEEEHLWECKQLGAHSPHVLLNTLIYFNTRFFDLNTPEQHLKLAFSHVLKAWKRNSHGAHPSRTVFLRYYPPQDSSKGRKKDDEAVYEQMENTSNPLRCPVKLFEFYVSKCPESIKQRSDLFYLVPERSCVPDSPVWYSVSPLGYESMNKMLNRVKLVRELQTKE